MSFLALAARRCAVRSYCPDPVADEQIRQILEAARLAPTAANRQPFQVLVVHTDQCQAALPKIYDRDWFPQAPVLLIVCGLPGEAWVHANGTSMLDVDLAIVTDHMALAATGIGLGSCWIASFDPDAVRATFGIPQEVVPLLMLALGHPAAPPPPKERKPLEALVRWERW